MYHVALAAAAHDAPETPGALGQGSAGYAARVLSCIEDIVLALAVRVSIVKYTENKSMNGNIWAKHTDPAHVLGKWRSCHQMGSQALACCARLPCMYM